MKKIVLGLAAVALLFTISCENTKKIQDIKMETSIDSLSYALGVNIGESMKQGKLTEVNTDIMAVVIKAILEGDTAYLKMNNDSAMMCINNYMMKKRDEEAKAAIEEGKKFMDENGKKAGVITTASGLQYKVITSGTGISPVDGDQVTVNYTGKLLDGTVFDSSIDNGQPVTFPINGVMRGWTEALELMKEGDKWEVYVPSSLGYGPSGAGGVIPPNATLIFELELLKVTKPAPSTK